MKSPLQKARRYQQKALRREEARLRDGEEKQLLFSCNTQAEDFDHIEVTIRKGLFGVDIITKTKPILQTSTRDF